MHLHTLHIEGFRGIRDLQLNLQPGVNVLAGPNGAGKSSVVETCAILLAEVIRASMRFFDHPLALIAAGEPLASSGVNASLGWRAPRPGVYTEDVELYSSLHRLIELLEPEDTFPFVKGGDVNKTLRRLHVSAVLHRGEAQAKLTQGGFALPWRREPLLSTPEDALDALTQLLNQTWDGEQRSLPVLVRYPAARAMQASSVEAVQIPLHPLAAYVGALRARADFDELFRWFRSLEDLENERRLSDTNELNYRHPQLEAVRRSLGQLLPGFQGASLRVDRRLGSLVIQKESGLFQLDQLSDGEKGLLALVGDLARRLALANPNAEDPLQGDGIVLIDEIELHLHPAWQRSVLNNLQRTFPGCQFIVTTHSPTVLSEIAPECVHLLRDTPERGVIAEHPSASYGMDIGRVQVDLMGGEARPQAVEELFTTAREQLKQADLEAADRALSTLREKLGAVDPDLSYLEALLHRKRVLGR